MAHNSLRVGGATNGHGSNPVSEREGEESVEDCEEDETSVRLEEVLEVPRAPTRRQMTMKETPTKPMTASKVFIEPRRITSNQITIVSPG
jgi:hypothetical protein